MPYIRHDYKNDPVPTAGGTISIGKNVDQAVSKITYEVYNQKYERSDPGPDQSQPLIKEGWNADYVRSITKPDGTIVSTTGLSKQFVQQSIYQKSNVNNQSVSSEPYVGSPLWPSKTSEAFTIPEDDGTFTIEPGQIGLLSVQSDGELIFTDELGMFAIQVESNTTLSQYVPDTNSTTVINTEDNESTIQTSSGYDLTTE